MTRCERGAAAELIALAHERLRLGDAGADQIKFVGDRKGFGYDIQSCEGEGNFSPRFIEVKSVAPDGSIFLTECERISLSALGDRAWIYLVDLSQSRVTKTIQNPLKVIGTSGTPLTYKIKI